VPRLAILLLLALVLAACGSDDGGSEESGQPAGGTGSLEFVLTDFAIEPPSEPVEPGTYTARVVNEGGTVHALKVDGPAGETESPQVDPGKSVELELSLTEAGEYELTCPVGDHRDRGMEAVLHVGSGAGGTTTDGTTTDETTTEDDDEDEDSDYRY
jgi:plastocyanin